EIFSTLPKRQQAGLWPMTYLELGLGLHQHSARLYFKHLINCDISTCTSSYIP
ncbi:unnamed protein product, partial [Allacma fusca]